MVACLPSGEVVMAPEPSREKSTRASTDPVANSVERSLSSRLGRREFSCSTSTSTW